MKKIFMIPVFLFLACNNNSDKQGNKENATVEKSTSSGDNLITFKVDGDPVNSEGMIVQRFVWDRETPGVWINITSSMHKDKRTINVNLNGGIAKKYIFKEGKMMENPQGTYFPDFSSSRNSFLFESGEFNITEVDTINNVLSGTFFGLVKNDDKTMNITEGKIVKAKMKPGIINLSEAFEQMKQ